MGDLRRPDCLCGDCPACWEAWSRDNPEPCAACGGTTYACDPGTGEPRACEACYIDWPAAFDVTECEGDDDDDERSRTGVAGRRGPG